MHSQTLESTKPMVATHVANAEAFDVYVIGCATFPGYGNDQVALHHVDTAGMWFRSSRRPAKGEALKFALRGFEDFEACVTELTDDGFLAMPNRKMGISSLVAEVAKVSRSQEASQSERRHERVSPKDLRATLRIDGASATVNVIDISVSGAAIESLLRPSIGTEAMLGRMPAKVVRHISNGFAVEFKDTLAAVSEEMRAL